jgi:hypothetical protein
LSTTIYQDYPITVSIFGGPETPDADRRRAQITIADPRLTAATIYAYTDISLGELTRLRDAITAYLEEHP